MKKIYKQATNKLGRNGLIYKARLAGCNYAEIAEAFDLSPQRVEQICKQVSATITIDEYLEYKKLRIDFLDHLRQMAMEIALLDPAPAFAPNGKAHFDPATGQTVYDYGPRLNAVDRLLKIDERFAKVTGTDSATQHRVEVTAEAERATQEQADKAAKQFSLIIPESLEVLAHARG